VTNLGSNYMYSVIGTKSSAMFLMKSSDLSSLDVYQSSALTVLSSVIIALNSTLIVATFYSLR
jgi:hypothetical protein